jgi:hypothetical protein
MNPEKAADQQFINEVWKVVKHFGLSVVQLYDDKKKSRFKLRVRLTRNGMNLTKDVEDQILEMLHASEYVGSAKFEVRGLDFPTRWLMVVGKEGETLRDVVD